MNLIDAEATGGAAPGEPMESLLESRLMKGSAGMTSHRND